MNTTKSPSKKKAASKKKVGVKKAPVKKKVPKKKKDIKNSPITTPKPSVSNKDRYEMITTMAYYRSEKRNFEPGKAMDDWLECEKLVDEMISKA